MINRIKAWFGHSLTILWARLISAAGLVLAAAEAALQEPAVSQAIQAALHPAYVPYYVIAIGLITELARRRSLERRR